MRWGVRDEMTDEHMTTVRYIKEFWCFHENVAKLRNITVVFLYLTTICFRPFA